MSESVYGRQKFLSPVDRLERFFDRLTTGLRLQLYSVVRKRTYFREVEVKSLFELKNYMQNKFGFDFPQKNELP